MNEWEREGGDGAEQDTRGGAASIMGRSCKIIVKGRLELMFLRFSLPSLAISHGADSVGKRNLKEKSERDDRQPTTKRCDELYGNWEAKRRKETFDLFFSLQTCSSSSPSSIFPSACLQACR